MFAQQNLSGRNICILILPVNRRNDVLARSERIVEVAVGMSLGVYVVLENTAAVRRGLSIGLTTEREVARPAGTRGRPR